MRNAQPNGRKCEHAQAGAGDEGEASRVRSCGTCFIRSASPRYHSPLPGVARLHLAGSDPGPGHSCRVDWPYWARSAAWPCGTRRRRGTWPGRNCWPRASWPKSRRALPRPIRSITRPLTPTTESLDPARTRLAVFDQLAIDRRRRSALGPHDGHPRPAGRPASRKILARALGAGPQLHLHAAAPDSGSSSDIGRIS